MGTVGKNADYIPALASVPNKMAIAVSTVSGEHMCVGDCEFKVAIESVSKIFTLALVLSQGGEDGDDKLLHQLGNSATGMAFNSAVAVELEPEQNALVNAGAMATVSTILPKGDAEAKWSTILGFYNRLAGTSNSSRLTLMTDVYDSEMATNTHNVGLANLMDAKGKFYDEVPGSVDVYTRQCSVGTSAAELARMSSMLAGGGTAFGTNDQILTEAQTERVLAAMATAGLYEASGDWLWKVGVPAKSGVGGSMVAVVPGKYSVAVVSPPLDSAGNSVKGQAAIAELVKQTSGSILKRSV